MKSIWENAALLINEFRNRKAFPGKGFHLLDELRESRNHIRHSQYKLPPGKDVPSSYPKEISQICAHVTSLIKGYNYFLPQTAKILSYNQDYKGCLELQLALETQRFAVLRYSHREDAQSIGGIKVAELTYQLIYCQDEYEFFLFPPAQPDDHTIMNRFLLARKDKKESYGAVPIKPEAIAVKLPAEFEEEEIEEIS